MAPIELVGWAGTVIFCASFLFKSRTNLHLVGIVGAVVKLAYTLHYGLMPLAVNWLIVIITHSVSLLRNSGKSQITAQ